jgi:hypothetical protein
MSSLVAIGLSALGASMVSDEDTETYWIAGTIALPEAYLDSLGEAWMDHEDGAFIIRPFVESVQGPPGMAYWDKRLHDAVFELSKSAIEIAPRAGSPRGKDEIQTLWIENVIGNTLWSKRGTSISFFAIEGGEPLYMRTAPGSVAWDRWLESEDANPAERVRGRGSPQEPPFSGQKDAIKRLLGRVNYHFVLLEEGNQDILVHVPASSYHEAIDHLGQRLERDPAILVIRGGRVLVDVPRPKGI